MREREIMAKTAGSKRQKGNRLELAVAQRLREAGFDARRMPLSGAADGFEGDIYSPETGFCWELKNQETWSIGKWWDQAKDQAYSKPACLVISRNRYPEPLVVIELKEFVWLLKNRPTELAYSKRKQVGK